MILSIFPIRKKERWPYNKNVFVLIYTGTVTDHYRLDIAVRAVASAAKFIAGIRLIILGNGNRLQQILKLTANLGIDDRVEHLDYVLPNKVKEIISK